MERKLSFSHSKVARRILFSFVLAALIPIAILGVLSFQQVKQQLQAQTAKALQRGCKDYAYGLVSRLLFAENSLRLAALKIHKSNKDDKPVALASEQWLQGQFTGLAVLSTDGQPSTLSRDNTAIPTLAAEELAQIVIGKTLIKPVSGQRLEDNRLWMAINLVENSPKAGILMAELKPDLLWNSETIDPNNLLWVMAADSLQILFALEQDFDPSPELRAQVAQANSGRFSWQRDGEAYLGAYWKLPVATLFFGPDLIVVQSLPESLAFAAIRQFSAIYPPVILLAALIVVYLSSRLIAKYLTPLERLKIGTQRVADGNLECRVDIDSHDEFEELADSFNEMTRRLRSQFDILATMAEIDRHILSALNAEDIIDTALNRLPSILFCDLISIAAVNPDTGIADEIRVRRSGRDAEILAEPVILSQQDVADLRTMHNGALEIANNDERMSEYLQVLGVAGVWRYLLVPVHVNGALASLICLGYQAPKQIPPESRNAAINFGDRIAVALSNAAWEEKLYQHAHYDSLTGLPNRLVLHDRLGQEIARARRDDAQLAVFFMDLDRFKNVNDSLGHAAGDELLRQAARIFLNCVRATDLVVRLGGDEFVIVIGELHTQHNPAAFVSAVAEKVLAALKQPVTVAGLPMTVTTSIGIALFPDDADNVPDLLKNADAAMYHAKSEGRANFRFYSPELNAAALENIKLEQELRGAIGRNELLVFYQPKVDWDGRIVGAEALIRWRHTELGMISPAKFIPLAEQTSLIVEISDWVLEQTCLWVNACHAQGLGPLRISVNLSAVDFKHPDLVEKIAAVLSKTGTDPKFIELELTESVAIGNIKTCIERMHHLKALGLTLSMDDFGTGFSSLSYLKELPLDVLKIDQSFVRQLESDDSSAAIVRAILALADGLGMETIAEGVETAAQLELLKQHHCGLFQGYLFSRPVPSDEFLSLLQADAAKRGAELPAISSS
ncbi:EAL domain-containing protein [Methylomonas sp. EFPC1]|uniref:EAL domain-containing protein n=1 Tax=Methylomonas sp. EFPC1 TaxID=2812647 RepID=UPI001966D43D|nr:EAL domain-containing protein [Methylomonas sp. EFPC1]QSB00624.1 EAL domain-containing protein [Methylomonas sp. EFPC1]